MAELVNLSGLDNTPQRAASNMLHLLRIGYETAGLQVPTLPSLGFMNDYGIVVANTRRRKLDGRYTKSSQMYDVAILSGSTWGDMISLEWHGEMAIERCGRYCGRAMAYGDTLQQVFFYDSYRVATYPLDTFLAGVLTTDMQSASAGGFRRGVCRAVTILAEASPEQSIFTSPEAYQAACSATAGHTVYGVLARHALLGAGSLHTPK